MAISTLDSFYQRVSRAARRGKVYDEDIPGITADVVRELENANNYKHMWNEIRGGVLTVGTDTLDLALTFGRVKDVRFIHLVSLDGREFPLVKSSAEDVISFADSGRPTAFWMRSQSLVAFDAKPDVAYQFALGVFNYTPIPLTNSCPWLTIAPDLLVARVMVDMHPLLRDDRVLERWGNVIKRKEPALMEANLMLDEDGADNTAIPFVTEVAEDEQRDAIYV